jgi:RimJ/RimL family protein N-acetyltransferase
LDKSDLIAAPRSIRTPRLRLEAPSVQHAAQIADFLNASLPSWPFINWPRFTRDLAWAQSFCARGLQYVEDGENLIFNVFREDSGPLIGRIDFHNMDFEAPRAEIGYVGDPRHAGLGLMREAVLATADMVFALGFARIEAISDVRNERAIAFAKCMGFKQEGIVRHRERDPQGELCDQAMLALLNVDRIKADRTSG